METRVKLKFGNCYERSFLLLVGTKLGVLVHGVARSQNELTLGDKMIHSWVEYNGYCFDYIDDKLKCIKKELYYKLGCIEDTTIYTLDEAIKNCDESGHYGFWNKKYYEIDKESLKLAKEKGIDYE